MILMLGNLREETNLVCIVLLCSFNNAQFYAKIYNCGNSILPVHIKVLLTALSFFLPCYLLMIAFVFSD